MILSGYPEKIIERFKEIGFECPDSIDDRDITNVRMKDANGFCLDVARVESMARDVTTIRMNVSDFDEAYEILKAHGFIKVRDIYQPIESESTRSCLMSIPSGVSIHLTRHIKD